jgi:DNA-binding CsgD family transcriptional regulator
MFGFDKAGRAFIVREAAGADDIVRVRAGRLRAADPRQQARVSVTVERAQVERRPVSTMLYDPDDTAWIFSVVPAAAMAPAWMTPFVAWAVLAPCASPEEAAPARLRQIAELFGLSAAEARVAALIGSARTVANTAKVMSITPGTVRNHLKSIFSKTGVARQAELAVLLSRV